MPEEQLRNTPLFAEHLALGARMVPFSGWNMPVQYPDGIIAEHEHTRNEVSLFDICHMGEFRIAGPGAAAALDKALARPLLDQKTGSCRYNFLLSEDGSVLDDLIVYRMDEEDFFVVVNAGTIASDACILRARLPETVGFHDLSDRLAKLDLQGPKSAEVLAACGISADRLPAYYRWTMTELDGVKCILSRTGYTGELGFELYFDAEKAVQLWRLLLGVSPVRPAGLGARDTLRLEMGYALYGHELSTEVTPLEAGYGAMLKLEDPARNFVGRDALRERKVKQQLCGIRLESRRAGRAGSKVLSPDGREIGRVTSGAFAPSLGVAVAMAYCDTAASVEPGTQLICDTGSVQLAAKAVSMPFYPNGTVRQKI